MEYTDDKYYKNKETQEEHDLYIKQMNCNHEIYANEKYISRCSKCNKKINKDKIIYKRNLA